MKLPVPLLALVAACLLSCLVPATTEASVGARVLLQAWNPLTPDQANVITVADQPGLVSQSLADAWTELRPQVCAQLKGRMGVGGAAGGQTLYDIECQLDEQARFEIRSGGQNALAGTITVGGYLEATSTTPTVLGSDFDPRVSVHVTARLDLVLAIQSSREQTLRVTQARFSVSNAKLDSHNATADVIAFVAEDLAPFFGGPDFKVLAENAINTLSLDFANKFNEALAPVNALLAGPSDTVRVGVSASGGYITVAFAPREIAPITTGIMRGTLRWDTTQFEPRNGCQSFTIRATVQTGPVPMFTANAAAPTRELGSFQASPSGPGACAFTLSGLAVNWPNFLSARVIDGNARASTGSRLYAVSYSLAGEGWDGRKVVPQPVASPRDYRVSRSIDATATTVGDYGSMKAEVERATDPRINPADIYTQRATPRAPELDSLRVIEGTRPGEAASLNPQPLPPRVSDSTGPVVVDRAAQAGIIIVSGKASDPIARKSSSLGGVFAPKVDPIAVPSQVRSQSAPMDYSALEARGPEIAAQDELATLLRDAQSEGPMRRGFDIGMAAAEGQTLPGPGKQRIHDSLVGDEQRGFSRAVDFSLMRNNNAKLAKVGAAIAAQDDELASRRNAVGDAFYRLGFDIATGLFGDPSQGAQGNTLTGPGSLGIRDGLDPAGQRGFNDSVAYHLSRSYSN
jgi:hypothetical protein